jgi:putative tricarboxylic transport membrane protein
MNGFESKARGIAPYAVVLALAGYLYYRAGRIESPGDQALGPALWPKTVLALAILTCVLAIAARLFAARPSRAAARAHPPAGGEADEGEAVEAHSPPGGYYPWIGIGLTIMYVALFPQLGYFLATILFVTAFIHFGNHRRPATAAIVGVAASFAFMFIFMRVVYVSLPVGVNPFVDVSMFVMRLLGIR